jgi:hypothetical protein
VVREEKTLVTEYQDVETVIQVQKPSYLFFGGGTRAQVVKTRVPTAVEKKVNVNKYQVSPTLVYHGVKAAFKAVLKQRQIELDDALEKTFNEVCIIQPYVYCCQ